MEKIVIGIDPGHLGSVAWRDGKGVRHVSKMPDTPRGIIDLVRSIEDEVDENGIIRPSTDYVCYLEDVGKGVPGQSSSATATFARHNGHLEMAMICEGIRIVKVLPQKWMKSLGIGKSSDCSTKAEWKRKLKQKAEELYPQFKVTLNNADALLILDYGIECEKGK